LVLSHTRVSTHATRSGVTYASTATAVVKLAICALTVAGVTHGAEPGMANSAMPAPHGATGSGVGDGDACSWRSAGPPAAAAAAALAARTAAFILGDAAALCAVPAGGRQRGRAKAEG
jgi:hypothetical protein